MGLILILIILALVVVFLNRSARRPKGVCDGVTVAPTNIKPTSDPPTPGGPHGTHQ